MGGYLMSHGKTNLELGTSAADYDNDGLPDVFLSGWGKTLRLFRNRGNVNFEDVTANLIAPGLLDINQGLWIDANNDGFLDLYLTDEHFSNRLLVNQRNGVLSERNWTLSFIDSSTSQGGSVADFDMDGDQDIYVCNWFHPDYLLINDGTGLFSQADLDLPTLTGSYSANSATTADIDNDGDPDLIISTKDSLIFLYRNTSSEGKLSFISEERHPFFRYHHSVYGTLLEDFDHDGWLDCFITGMGRNRLYLNDGKGGFTENFDEDNLSAYSTGSAVADLDNDGDLDILVANKDQYSQIYLNPTNDRHFLNLRIIGVNSNRDALGTKVYFHNPDDSLRSLIGYREVRVNRGYLSSSDPLVHFGTGTHQTIDVRIVFPSGQIQERSALRPGKTYTVYEYGPVLRNVYFAWNNLLFQASQKEFWWDLGLVVLLILVVIGYLTSGLKRYYWTAFSVSLQLSLWFILALTILVFLSGTGILVSLLILNGISIFGAIISMIFSEYQRRMRLKRSRFRKMLQDLSDEMINIHENELLFRKLVEAVASHENIRSSVYFINQGRTLRTFPSSGDAVHHKIDDFSLTASQESVLGNEKIIRTKAHPDLFEHIPEECRSNILIPVKRKGNLFGVLGIQMINEDNPLNGNDLQQISTIANQTAVAIENNLYIKETADLIQQLTESKIRKQYVEQLEETNRALDEKNMELTRLFKELQNKEAQLIHSEKMASLGQLVAGISHELNNPISFIYANMNILTEYIDELDELIDTLPGKVNGGFREKFHGLMQEFRSIIVDSSGGSRAVKEIVQNLRNFSRLDQAEWKDAHLVPGIESSLNILKHQIPGRISVRTEFKDDPVLYCNPGQLHQVFVNIISNALHAIPDEGEINISTELEDNMLAVRIQDSGVGIPKEIIPKIFDPFFTTKDVNSGTGLGLSISYSILKKHNANIDVNSTPGKGTTFTLRFPLNSERGSKDD
jgi:signal transduction histidine kinase